MNKKFIIVGIAFIVLLGMIVIQFVPQQDVQVNEMQNQDSQEDDTQGSETLESEVIGNHYGENIFYEVPQVDFNKRLEDLNRMLSDIPDDSRQLVENLYAFTKLYGYIRYFHPSDESAKLYWPTFAVYGVQQVSAAKDTDQLKQVLEELFLPIAPTMKIYYSYEQPSEITYPEDIIQNAKVIAWEHVGVGITPDYPFYSSKRLESTSPENIEIFGQVLSMGETINKLIHPELKISLPLLLYTTDQGTIGTTEQSHQAYSNLKNTLDKDYLSIMNADKKMKWYADLVIAWNIFQHFYPYFDVVNVNWEQELITHLLRTVKDEEREDFHFTLKSLIAALEDGHGAVIDNYQSKPWVIPIRLDWIENEIVVTNSEIMDRIKSGDILMKINGVDSKEVLLENEKYISGSPQWKRHKALQEILTASYDEEITLTLQRGDQLLDIKVDQGLHQTRLIDDFDRPFLISEIEDQIYYVNLNMAEMHDFGKYIEQIANAKGVIFDLRGYPNSNHNVIRYMINEPVQSARWNLPLLIYPDQETLIGYNTDGRWLLEPKEPKIKGKIVFLTHSGSISYAESVMGIIEHYKLAEIIGQPTAGANGNINPFDLPSGFRIHWTGMKVLKHDGSQHHLIGIQPTIPIERTIEAIREGRDEYMEKALEVIKAAQ